MKRQLFSFLLLFTFAVGLSAQKAQKASSLEANLRRHVEYLASDKLEGRRAGEPGAVLAGNYVAEQFKKIGLKPGFTGNGKPDFKQPFSYTPVRDPHSAPVDPTAAAQEKNAFNVIGILPGHDPVLKNEAIVLGAHYDHLGHGGSGSLAANSTEIHHGADDNASGTAAVIELARIFAGQKSNKRTLVFIAFSGEEDGVFGSKYYVNNPVFPLDKTIAMINLDMVGRLQNEKLTIGGIGTAHEWKDLVNVQNTKGTNRIISVGPNGAEAENISPSFTLFLNEDGFGPSDHSSFYGKNIPVLFFFTGTHLDYHKPSDTADKINYEGESKLVNYVAAIAKSVDENPTRPTYAVAKSSNTGGRTTFSVSLGTIPSYADSTDGMELDGVRDGSPAAKAGLKKGDKVIKLAGKDIKNVYDYTDALSGMKPDVEYEVVINRGAETLTLKIVPAAARR
jgi:Zn-dependent M28 family amino/carboxypeptidase